MASWPALPTTRPPAPSGTEARFAVTATFPGGPGDQVGALHLNIIGSDSALTAGGTDFSRFPLELDPATLPGWPGPTDGLAAGVAVYGVEQTGPQS